MQYDTNLMELIEAFPVLYELPDDYHSDHKTEIMDDIVTRFDTESSETLFMAESRIGKWCHDCRDWVRL